MRASLNTSDYLRNWESCKIAPLEQWGGDPYLPHGTTVLDNMRTEDSGSRLVSCMGGEGVGGGGILGLGTPLGSSSQQCSSLCHRLSCQWAVVAETWQSSAQFNENTAPGQT